MGWGRGVIGWGWVGGCGRVGWTGLGWGRVGWNEVGQGRIGYSVVGWGVWGRVG